MTIQVAAMIVTVIGIVVATAVAISNPRWKRSRDERDRFLAAVLKVEADFERYFTPGKSVEQFHQRSLEPLRSAVYAVQPYVRKASFELLFRLWTNYKDLGPDQLNWAFSAAKRDLQQADNVANPTRTSDKLLRDYYEKLRKAVG